MEKSQGYQKKKIRKELRRTMAKESQKLLIDKYQGKLQEIKKLKKYRILLIIAIFLLIISVLLNIILIYIYYEGKKSIGKPIALQVKMPIKNENKGLYPKYWKELSEYIRFVRADNKCEFDGCDAENYKPHPITRSKVILTVAHLDHNPENNHAENLKAGCQKCHLNYDKYHHMKNRQITYLKKNWKGQLPLFESAFDPYLSEYNFLRKIS